MVTDYVICVIVTLQCVGSIGVIIVKLGACVQMYIHTYILIRICLLTWMDGSLNE